ncbi:MAG: S66 peptidase family protein [Patescibacteria group bacterium]
MERDKSLENKTNLLKPERLKGGDTIMLISPGSGLAGVDSLRHRADNGKVALERMGFKVVEGIHSRVVGERAGTAEERASDIHEGLINSEVKAFISMIGGYNVCAEVLPHLDYELVKKNPKIFMGYSDVTALLFGIYCKTGLITFYGPAVMTEFGDYPDVLPYTRKWMEKALTSTEPIGRIEPADEWTDEFLDWGKKLDLTRPREMQPSRGWEWLQQGKTKGKLLGGCIQSLAFLTENYPEYLPDFSESIFFWESAEKKAGIGHAPEEVLTDLQKIKEFGILNKMKGMIVGRPYKYNDTWHEDLKKLILDVVSDPSKPIVYNVEIGHTNPILTLPLGIHVTINSDENLFSVDEAGVG